MRADSLGLFWEDRDTQRTRSGASRTLPPVPETGWTTPRAFPNLSRARVIAFDIETYDPHLLTMGPGWTRGGEDDEPLDGFIVGISIAVEDRAWYFPTRHPDSDNVDETRLYAWLRETLSNAKQAKVGANLMYDAGWLSAYDVHVRGPMYDVQCAEPLLDDNALSYSLDTISLKYEGEGKNTTTLYEWCAEAFGGKADESQRKNIWRTPARIVGPYAEQDASLPLRIIRKQIEQLRKEDLFDLFKMETCLLPLLLDMQRVGVRVDTKQADIVHKQLHSEYIAAQRTLDTMAGVSVNVNAARSIAAAFDAMGLPYRKTRKGAPSFTKQWLSAQGHPFAQQVSAVRKLQKASATFVESYIYGHLVGDRIHAQFHPLRNDTNGTVTGRFASSNPNMQNIPSRDEYIAPLIRSMYIPLHDGAVWRRYDYSQIEYRFLAHFATGHGAEDVRDRYRNDPSIDFHAMVAQLIDSVIHVLLERGQTKNVNFGLVYGMSEEALRAFLGMTHAEAAHIFDAYHSGAPFIRHTYNSFMNEARTLGEVRTILGRKRRFVWWESAVAGVHGNVLRHADAKRAYGFVRRAYTHKALNAALQGSAADIIKQAMVDAYHAGIFDVTGVPHIQVHDELGFTDERTHETRQAFEELTHIMQTCIPLSVPVLVAQSEGKTWGACK